MGGSMDEADVVVRQTVGRPARRYRDIFVTSTLHVQIRAPHSVTVTRHPSQMAFGYSQQEVDRVES